MHVLFVASKKEELKLKEKFYDLKFSKISDALAGADIKKIPKDVHAIVAYCGKDDLKDIGSILDSYDKYQIKAMFGKSGDDAKNLQSQGWEFFEFQPKDELTKLDPLRTYIKQTFDAEVNKIKQIFDAIDTDGNKYLEPYELTRVSEMLGKPFTKEEIDNCVKIIDADGNGQISFDEFALWWIAGREGAP